MTQRRLVSRLLAAVVAFSCLVPIVLFLALWIRLSADRCHVAVLMYHGVIDSTLPPQRYAMRESEFARQMAELRMIGAVTPPVDELLAALRGTSDSKTCQFRPNEVVITFDLDGAWHDIQHVVPHLSRNGFAAIFFVPSGFLDHGRAVSSDDVRQLAAYGMTIASHTEYHYDMRTEQPASMIASLRHSRAVLSGLSGQSTSLLSAPGGRYNDRVIEGVRAAGFEGFFTSDPCYAVPRSSRFRVCRIEIRGDGGMTAADAVRSPWRVALQATEWHVKRGVEMIIGRALWRRLHTWSERYPGLSTPFKA